MWSHPAVPLAGRGTVVASQGTLLISLASCIQIEPIRREYLGLRNQRSEPPAASHDEKGRPTQESADLADQRVVRDCNAIRNNVLEIANHYIVQMTFDKESSFSRKLTGGAKVFILEIRSNHFPALQLMNFGANPFPVGAPLEY